MLSKSRAKMRSFLLLNSWIFWGIIIFLAVIISYLYKNDLEIVEKTHSAFEEHSFNPNNKYDFPKIDVQLEPEPSTLTQLFSKENILTPLLILYSICLSVLFTYREKSRVSKEILDEKIRIEKERTQPKVDLYMNIQDELSKFKNILSPQMNIEYLDKKLVEEVDYILFNSRVILEKILVKISNSKGFESETLADTIHVLYKHRILSPQANGYAHTIKAFGNRVAHPNFTNPIKFTTKDALLVLSTLVALLNILSEQKLLECENVS